MSSSWGDTRIRSHSSDRLKRAGARRIDTFLIHRGPPDRLVESGFDVQMTGCIAQRWVIVMSSLRARAVGHLRSVVMSSSAECSIAVAITSASGSRRWM